MAQLVGEARDERRFGADDDEVDPQLQGERDERGMVVGAHGMAVGKRGDTGVAGSGVQLVEVRATGERPGERVLATSRPDDEHSHRGILFEPAFRIWNRVQDWAMYDPGLNRHEWESEWEALDEHLRADPAQALPELDALVARMLEESGYDLTDPVARDGGEREVVVEYLAAHEIVEAAEHDFSELSPGDVAAAINGYRAVFDHVVSTRATADAALDAAEAEEA
jgi:hypothetical protein